MQPQRDRGRGDYRCLIRGCLRFQTPNSWPCVPSCPIVCPPCRTSTWLGTLSLQRLTTSQFSSVLNFEMGLGPLEDVDRFQQTRSPASNPQGDDDNLLSYASPSALAFRHGSLIIKDGSSSLIQSITNRHLIPCQNTRKEPRPAALSRCLPDLMRLHGTLQWTLD